MKQYCRYCSHLVYDDVAFCRKKNWAKTYSSCKQRNKCKDFELNPIDALAENLNGYKPREKKIEIDEQTRCDRDSFIKYFSAIFGTIAEVSTFTNYTRTQQKEGE